MPNLPFAVRIERGGDVLQDRVRVIEHGDILIVAVADGAGGFVGSENAAEAVVRGATALLERGGDLEEELPYVEFLREIDEEISRVGHWGEATGVVLGVTGSTILGASVGDSEAWLATDRDFLSLTSGQIRRPFLGSGAARPVAFRRAHSGGTLIVATDGLFKYAPAWRICEVARTGSAQQASQSLLDSVRMPNGKLQDDTAIALVRLPEIKSP